MARALRPPASRLDYVLDLDDGGDVRGERLLIATDMGAPGPDGASAAVDTD